MLWCAAFLTGGTGWDAWLPMCAAVAISWVLAVAGMVTLFGASAQNSDPRPRLRPETSPPPSISGEPSPTKTLGARRDSGGSELRFSTRLVE